MKKLFLLFTLILILSGCSGKVLVSGKLVKIGSFARGVDSPIFFTLEKNGVKIPYEVYNRYGDKYEIGDYIILEGDGWHPYYWPNEEILKYDKNEIMMNGGKFNYEKVEKSANP